MSPLCGRCGLLRLRQIVFFLLLLRTCSQMAFKSLSCTRQPLRSTLGELLAPKPSARPCGRSLDSAYPWLRRFCSQQKMPRPARQLLRSTCKKISHWRHTVL